jgi:hypothetical protein
MKGTLTKIDDQWYVEWGLLKYPVYQHTFDMTKHSPKSIIPLKEGAEVNFTIENFWETGLEKTIQIANLVYTDDKVEKPSSGLDETYYNEFLDRLTIIGEMIERFLIDHPVCDEHDNVYYLISEAMKNIVDAHLKTQDIMNIYYHE